ARPPRHRPPRDRPQNRPRKDRPQKPESSVPALAIRPAAIISITEGTRTRATTSWIFGAARAARSSTARRPSRRGLVAWRRSCSASGEPKRRGASTEGARGGSSAAGHARGRERGGERAPAGGLGDGDPHLLGQRTFAGTGELGEAVGWPAAGGDADREQIEGVRKRSDEAPAATARLAVEQGVGDEESGRR